ncbi:putative glycerol kinase 5 [Hyposmocoma kahamanoa]|uniref:putative glycerol kinase 5 n=1 Tax=Hyposmocoma kahamanoa TaxID=1477025 RepID=UPI000E6D6121|nr:putative glycerol kinase 5 [Hyposmocoma kahamanoa]
MEEKYILSLDIGTTTIRSFIYNSRAEIVDKAITEVVLHYPSNGFVEIDPDELWQTIVEVVQKSLKNASLSPGQVTGMGISTQRSTFITWSRKTGKPFHRFITWKDMRADKLVKQWNDSYTWKLIRAGAYVLYLMSGSRRFRAGSVLKFMNTQTTLRLSWAMQNIAALKEAAKNNDAMFGTLDTWLLYKLTDHKIHMTDVSSASATGFFDPFTMQWAGWAMALFHIQLSSLPAVVDTAGSHFTSTSPKIWGHAIPIVSCMADQTASMWGSCCFDVGDIKLTMGTGTFFNINTGTLPHASISGLYPVVGWRLDKELVFVAEGANNDTASIIKWAQNLDLFDNPQDTADLAMSVPDSDGVYFIPAFSGLGPPYNDGSAASGFIGMKPTTTKSHLVRAVLESLAFRTAQLYSCVQAETSYNFHCIRLDGGVSNNDFIVQLVADLTGLRVERPVDVEMSSLGCAFIVGLQLGIWKSKEELKSLRKIGQTFHPRPQVKKTYELIISRWEDAVKRLCGWYSDAKSRQSVNSVSDSSSSSVTPQSSFKVSGKKNGRNGNYSKIK